MARRMLKSGTHCITRVRLCVCARESVNVRACVCVCVCYLGVLVAGELLVGEERQARHRGDGEEPDVRVCVGRRKRIDNTHKHTKMSVYGR